MPPDMKKNKILIVDDNMNNVQVLAGILENNGFDLEFALNGPDALQWLEDEHFDLVLLDIMMPGMDGFEVCRIIRDKEKTHEIPIIFLTAKTDRESLMRGFKCGGNDYLSKPYDQGELLARVNTHLELKQSRDQLKQINAFLEEKVTERTRELRQALLKVQELNKDLQELDEAKSEFLRIISHEIRTPLNGIMGFSEILKSTQHENPIIEYVDLLEISVNRLERFSLNALMITTLRLNKRIPKFGTLWFSRIIEESLAEIHIPAKNIKLNVDCPADISIFADTELVKICLINILRNAQNYAPKGGKIEISVIENRESVSVIIADDGPGFSIEALRNLFGYFSKGEKHVDGNEGLGLALCNQIMLFHKGTIEIKNRISGGAEVILIFPLAGEEKTHK
jgi:two-component system, sensor histidine kinase and response regulator